MSRPEKLKFDRSFNFQMHSTARLGINVVISSMWLWGLQTTGVRPVW